MYRLGAADSLVGGCSGQAAEVEDPLHAGRADPRARRVEDAISGTRLGPVSWVARTGSTNTDLLEAAAAGAAAGTVLTADHQSAGRGRRDRRWEAAAGDALMVSILLEPTDGVAGFAAATTAVGVAAVDACRALGAASVGLKWPNDLVVPDGDGHRKLAGILAQSSVSSERAAIVVGLGLNVRAANLGELASTAVALDQLVPEPDRVELLADLLCRLDELLAVAPHVLREGYRDRCVTLGSTVRVTTDDEVFVGLAVDVTDAGALVVRTATGIREVIVGDVVSVRPETGG